MLINPPVRGNDAHGSGAYLASRGDRQHKGVDFACYPGSELLSMCHGTITRFGFPYSHHPDYRYVEVTDSNALKFRFFYVQPNPDLSVGDKVKPGDILGTSQDLGRIYGGITNHIHFEVKRGREYLDPTDFV